MAWYWYLIGTILFTWFMLYAGSLDPDDNPQGFLTFIGIAGGLFFCFVIDIIFF